MTLATLVPITTALSLALAAYTIQGHAGHGTAAAAPTQGPSEPAVGVASPARLIATLQSDALDAPAPTAVQEAARAATLAREMAGGGHSMAHGSYVQVDAGRDDPPSLPSSATSDPHAGHHMPASPRPSPTPTPHPEHHR